MLCALFSACVQSRYICSFNIPGTATCCDCTAWQEQYCRLHGFPSQSTHSFRGLYYWFFFFFFTMFRMRNYAVRESLEPIRFCLAPARLLIIEMQQCPPEIEKEPASPGNTAKDRLNIKEVMKQSPLSLKDTQPPKSPSGKSCFSALITSQCECAACIHSRSASASHQTSADDRRPLEHV
jgi:hypothetical protein